MESPLEFTWAFPKFDGVRLIRVEKFLQFIQDGSSMNLEGMDITVKDFLGCMNGVGYNDDLGDIVYGASLIYAASNSKQLRFCCCYEGRMMNCFNKWLVC